MELVHIVGARPQFIKMAAVSRAIAQYNQGHAPDQRIKGLIVHTGQHYDYEMSKVFFDELEIPKPDYNLGVGSGLHGEQTGEMLKRVEQVLLKEKPDIVLVYGDTNSTLAGALAAAKLHIPVAHIEAGLRSFNRAMPEEINRVLTDHVSTILFCPTETAVKNLRKEGFINIANNGYLVSHSAVDSILAVNHELRTKNCEPVVFNIGDVMYDSVLYNLKLAEDRSDILTRLSLKPSKPMMYALATVHRAENTDDPARLRSIFQALDEIARELMPVILPLHPRTRKQLSALSNWTNSMNSMNPIDSTNSMNSTNPINPTNSTNLVIIDPVPYLDMLSLEENARLILTDSGGVQKEAFILKVPCVTLREETEWVETVEAGWNVLVGADEKRIVETARHFSSQRPSDLPLNPYGDGHAGERVVNAVRYLRE